MSKKLLTLNPKVKINVKPDIISYAGFPGQVSSKTINSLSKNLHHPFKEEMEFHLFKDLLYKTTNLYNRLVRYRGRVEGTKRFKDIRIYFIKHILGLKPDPIPCLSLHKDGFPKDLFFIKQHLCNEKYSLRLFMTLLNISRLSSHGEPIAKVDTKSITSGVNHTDEFKKILKDFYDSLPRIFRRLGIKPVLPSDLKFKFQNNERSGPNSALLHLDSCSCAPYDAQAVMSDRKLSRTFYRYFKLTKNLEVFNYIQFLSKRQKKRDDLLHSKIISIAQPENKTRVVAMVDYWSQAMLDPVVKVLNRAESKVENSYMFDQDSGREKARQFTLKGKPVSLDSVAFTDRFPLELQKQVLRRLFNDEFSEVVCNLLVNRRFKCGSSTIRYNSGQPMGANGSFQLANLTHALLAYWVTEKSLPKIPKSTIPEYSAVVGDDIVFSDNKISDLYKQKMTHLGVKFSEFKGFHSTSTVKIAEFCKRTYLDGKLISGLTPKPSLNYYKDFKFINSYINSLEAPVTDTTEIVELSPYKNKEKIYDLLNLSLLLKRSSQSISNLERCSEQVKKFIVFLQSRSPTERLALSEIFISLSINKGKVEEYRNTALGLNNIKSLSDVTEFSTILRGKSPKGLFVKIFNKPTFLDIRRRSVSWLNSLALGMDPKTNTNTKTSIPSSEALFFVTPVGLFYGDVAFKANAESAKALDLLYSINDLKTYIRKIGGIQDCLRIHELYQEVTSKSFYTGYYTSTLKGIGRQNQKDKENKDNLLFLVTRKMITLLPMLDYSSEDEFYLSLRKVRHYIVSGKPEEYDVNGELRFKIPKKFRMEK